MKKYLFIVFLLLTPNYVNATEDSPAEQKGGKKELFIFEPLPEYTHIKENENSEIFLQEHILNCMQPLGRHASLKEFVCPIGEEKFKSLELGPSTRFGLYLDLKPMSYMSFPVPVPVCPSNGFVIFKKEFSDPEIEKIDAYINSEEYKTLFKEKHASYFLFSKINAAIKNEKIDQWWLLLQSTWEAAGCKDEKKYEFYAKETIQEAKNALESLKPDNENFWTLNLLIPNLYRRIGDFSSAQNWLTKLGPIPDDQEKFQLGFKLLQEAITKNDKEPVPIREPKK